MPKFSYIARTEESEKKEGALEAKNEFQLARILKRKGLILISAQEKGTAKEKKGLMQISLFDKVSLIEKIMFTRNLRIMIAAGIALPKALKILSDQTKSNKLKKTLLGVREKISEGKSFSTSLEECPEIFPELFSGMVKVGEEGGRLEEVLDILSKQMERTHELKSKVKGAMIYPAVIIVAMVGIGALMLALVVPKIAATFRELKIDLPVTTKFVIWLGENLASKWYLMLGSAGLSLFLFFRFIKSHLGKRIFDTLTLKIPIISSIIKKTNSAYTTRILGSLIASGVPITHSLEILSGTLGNIHYKRAMEQAAERVRKGVTLSETLVEYENIYPSMIIQMIAVGEETGMTSEILEKLADFFEDEVAEATKNLASVIEPLIMLAIGGAVGFFAISMVQPMYSMLGAIK